MKVDKATGKAKNLSTAFRCYAASAERFPAVRADRWGNFETAHGGDIPPLPDEAHSVRIHSAGDFFNQSYFDKWLKYCEEHPDSDFWAYTKSVPYWLKRLADIPGNLVLTASLGGRFDREALKAGLRTATVIHPNDPRAINGPIDTNDDLARKPGPSFYLLDNNAR